MTEETPPKVLQLEICALDRSPMRAEATRLSLFTDMGMITILPGHAPLMVNLGIGVLSVWNADGEQHDFAISNGLARVLKDHVLVLTETMEMDVEIDIERAVNARDRAEQQIREAIGGGVDELRVEVALKRAIARIHAHARLQPRSKDSRA